MRQWACAVSAWWMLGMAAIPQAKGLSGSIPPDKPYENEHLSKKALALLNSHKRVYGWIQSPMGVGNPRLLSGITTLFYSGDVKGLNSFLADLPACDLGGVSLTVTLVPGPGKTSRGPQDKDVPFNWAVSLSRVAVLGEMQLKRGQDTISFVQRIEGAQWEIDIVVHVHGFIQMETLQLPLAYKAAFRSELQDLAKRHNDRRREAEQARKRKRNADLDPTTLGHLGGLYDEDAAGLHSRPATPDVMNDPRVLERLKEMGLEPDPPTAPATQPVHRAKPGRGTTK